MSGFSYPNRALSDGDVARLRGTVVNIFLTMKLEMSDNFGAVEMRFQ